QYPYTSGYLSEPEPGAYDSDFTDYRYQTLDRRRPNMQERQSEYTTSSTMPRSLNNKSSSSDILRNVQEPYKIQPGRIENYTPGHSSISEKEAKEHLEQQKRVPAQPRSFINQALKESGYESDSTLVFRRREEAAQQLSPKEQKEVYKVIQKGGDVPLHGLRKPAPERPKVTVHHGNQNTFAAYKRTAPSSASVSNIPTPPPIPPPSPPRRRSSRNNPTLRLVSTMKVKRKFTARRTSTAALGDLSQLTRLEICLELQVLPEKNPVNVSDESLNTRKSPTRTFGSEKRKFDLNLCVKRAKLDKSPDLLSPTEVKKAVMSQSKSASGTIYKKTNAVLSSTKTSRNKEILPIKVGISEKAKTVLRSSVQRPVSTSPSLMKRASPCPSTASERSKLVKSSLESLSSPKMSRKVREITRSPKPNIKETKKDFES
ncbi:hypothetical protein NQ314_006970, partial [Rhamnusium bicolor]